MYLPGYRMPQQRRVYGFAQASESGAGPLKSLANAEYIEYLSNRNMPYIHGEYVACEVLAFISALAGAPKHFARRKVTQNLNPQSPQSSDYNLVPESLNPAHTTQQSSTHFAISLANSGSNSQD